MTITDLSILDHFTEYYVQFGTDGHFHIVDDQKLAKQLFLKQLANLKDVPQFGKDCYAWVSNRH